MGGVALVVLGCLVFVALALKKSPVNETPPVKEDQVSGKFNKGWYLSKVRRKIRRANRAKKVAEDKNAQGQGS